MVTTAKHVGNAQFMVLLPSTRSTIHSDGLLFCSALANHKSLSQGAAIEHKHDGSPRWLSSILGQLAPALAFCPLEIYNTDTSLEYTISRTRQRSSWLVTQQITAPSHHGALFQQGRSSSLMQFYSPTSGRMQCTGWFADRYRVCCFNPSYPGLLSIVQSMVLCIQNIIAQLLGCASFLNL